VLETYPKDVKLVFKNYPLDDHKYARNAAAAALAAEKQGKFWEFHDLLFENQAELSDQKIKEISELLGLDWEKLSKDMQDPEIIAMITRDKSEGDRAGLSQIPTIFINGRRLKAINMQGFKAVIEFELQKLGKRAVPLFKGSGH
jgi:protein-disulfide isomerase